MHLKPKTGSVSTLTKTMGNAVISLLGTFFIFTLYRLATDHFKTQHYQLPFCVPPPHWKASELSLSHHRE